MKSGGHKYLCGHIKHCADHVQMAEENKLCNFCIAFNKALLRIGISIERKRLTRVVTELLDTGILDKEKMY